MNDDLVRESVGDGEKGKREREKSCTDNSKEDTKRYSPQPRRIMNHSTQTRTRRKNYYIRVIPTRM